MEEKRIKELADELTKEDEEMLSEELRLLMAVYCTRRACKDCEFSIKEMGKRKCCINYPLIRQHVPVEVLSGLSSMVTGITKINMEKENAKDV